MLLGAPGLFFLPLAPAMLLSMLAVAAGSYAVVTFVVVTLARTWQMVLDRSPSSLHPYIKSVQTHCDLSSVRFFDSRAHTGHPRTERLLLFNDSWPYSLYPSSSSSSPLTNSVIYS
jgi:hypothetical protein